MEIRAMKGLEQTSPQVQQLIPGIVHGTTPWTAQ
jgi:hypothetical protein